MRTSFSDSIIVSMIVGAICLAVVIFTLSFELSLLWTLLIVAGSFGALLFLLKIRKKA